MRFFFSKSEDEWFVEMQQAEVFNKKDVLQNFAKFDKGVFQ